jgi:REP element-mobilizing transposase RayT
VHRAGEPVHVTLRARLGVLRSQHVFPTVRIALARGARRDEASFRLLHFSVQHDHVHLVVEAADKRALSSGVRSLAIRVAIYVNELLMRRGSFWADRWHGRALKTPREVRNALRYVLANFRKHAPAKTNPETTMSPGVDPYSSAEFFDGFRDWSPASGLAPPFAERPAWRGPTTPDDIPVVAARSWLARVGWRRSGLLSVDEAPAAGRRCPPVHESREAVPRNGRP